MPTLCIIIIMWVCVWWCWHFFCTHPCWFTVVDFYGHHGADAHKMEKKPSAADSFSFANDVILVHTLA